MTELIQTHQNPFSIIFFALVLILFIHTAYEMIKTIKENNRIKRMKTKNVIFLKWKATSDNTCFSDEAEPCELLERNIVCCDICRDHKILVKANDEEIFNYAKRKNEKKKTEHIQAQEENNKNKQECGYPIGFNSRAFNPKNTKNFGE